MAVTHNTVARNAMVNALTALLNSGRLAIQNSTGGEVARLGLNATAFGASATGQAIANPITSDTSAAGGTAAKGELQTATGASRVLFSVTSTSGGGDMTIPSTSISTGQTVNCNTLRYAGPA